MIRISCSHGLFAGVISCKRYYKNGVPVGFVLFVSVATAQAAMQQMNGFALDPDNAKQIRVEFAKKNSKLRRDRKYYEDVAAGIAPSQAPMGQPPQLVVPQQYNMCVLRISAAPFAERLRRRFSGTKARHTPLTQVPHMVLVMIGPKPTLPLPLVLPLAPQEPATRPLLLCTSPTYRPTPRIRSSDLCSASAPASRPFV
jgi:hypothetical protein